jgi:hypothetical protein
LISESISDNKVQHISKLTLVIPDAVEVLQKPTMLFEELGHSLDGLPCMTCSSKTTPIKCICIAEKTTGNRGLAKKALSHRPNKIQMLFSGHGVSIFILTCILVKMAKTSSLDQVIQ